MTEDTPRGILSPADRDYLVGEKDLTASAERNARSRIRKRVETALSDLEFLWAYLSDRDLEQIFYPEDDDERKSIRSSSQIAISFLLLGLWTNRDPHPDRIEDAIEQAFFENGYFADADLSLWR